MPPPAGDWYSFLGVGPDATTEQIAAGVERLSRQANALAVTAPERARQLRDQARAIKQDLLAGPEARQRYDHGLAAAAPVPPPVPGPPPGPPPSGPVPGPPPPPPPGPAPGPAPFGYVGPAAPYGFRPQAPGQRAPGPQGPGLMSRISKFLQTGWTCVACGYGAQPTDKFCPKCGNRIESGLDQFSRTSGSGQAGPQAPRPAPQAPVTRCDNCGASAGPNDTFCMRCGRGLAPA